MRTTLARVGHRARYILFASDMSFVEMLLSVCYLGWGLVLTFTYQGLFAQSPTYNPLYEAAPQWAWGGACLVVGLTKVVGNLGEIRWLRAVGAFMGLLLWLCIATMFLLTVAVPTGLVVYFSFAATSLLTLLRHSRLIGLRMNNRGQ